MGSTPARIRPVRAPGRNTIPTLRVVSNWGRNERPRASDATSRTARVGPKPNASRATTTTLNEFPTTIPDTGTSTRASRGSTPSPNTTLNEIPRPLSPPRPVIQPRPGRRGSRRRAASPAIGTITATQAHAQAIDASPSRSRVSAQPAATNWAMARTVATTRSRSRPSPRLREIPTTTSNGTSEAINPHHGPHRPSSTAASSVATTRASTVRLMAAR